MSDIYRPADQEIEAAVRAVPFKEIEAQGTVGDVGSSDDIRSLAVRMADHIRRMVKKRKTPLHIAICSGLASMFEVGVLVGIQIGRTRQIKDQQGRLQ